MHDAGVVLTVAEFKGMPKFVDGLLDNTAEECLPGVDWRKVFFESVGRYDRGLSAQLRLSIDMGQNRDK